MTLHVHTLKRYNSSIRMWGSNIHKHDFGQNGFFLFPIQVYKSGQMDWFYLNFSVKGV